MLFITYKDLNNDVINNMAFIPKDIDVVVGVPRSGMLLANIIALYMNKPLVDLNGFIDHKIMSVGHTKNTEKIVSAFDNIKKALIVEDSINSGRSIIEAKKEIEEANLHINIVYLAAYIRSGNETLVDIYFRKIDNTRMFEWNYLHSNLLKYACFDIDGVLCLDPSDKENDDGDKYIQFIQNARPKMIPTRKIGYIVSSRLEKYRDITEHWLHENGIQYGQLILMDLSSAKERQELGNHGEYKAEAFRKLSEAAIFIESNRKQAEIIAQNTNKTVYCLENQYAYQGGITNNNYYAVRRKLKNKIRNLKTIIPFPVYRLVKKVIHIRKEI